MTTLDHILGQDEAVALLTRALRNDRLPHALLFAGPSGVGKATMGLALARVFLCEDPDVPKDESKPPAPCGQCDGCHAFDAEASHPDLHIITKELIRYHDRTGKSKGIDLSINVVRPELIEPAGRKALLGRGKVFIVEQADVMNPQAQNAILKTLEEPAGRTAIILLTDRPGMLLPTIRSRCQAVPFKPLSDEIVERQVAKFVDDADSAAVAASLSGGSLGRAVRFAEDGIIDLSAELDERLDKLDATGSAGDLHAWLKSAAEGYAEKQLERDPLASKDQVTRQGLSLLLSLIAERLRRSLRRDDIDAEGNAEAACGGIDAVADAQQDIASNVNVTLALLKLTTALEGRLAQASPAA